MRNLQGLNRRTDLRLVQLSGTTGQPYDFTVRGDKRTCADLATAAGLAGISRYADLVGPDKDQVIPVRPDGALGTPTSFVRGAHRAGLKVTPCTFRVENAFLPPALRKGPEPTAFGDEFSELAAFFADQPDIAKIAREGNVSG